MTTSASQQEIAAYLQAHPLAILGTLDEDGSPYGAAVYVWPVTYNQLYFVTKTDTRKYQNILRNPHVSVTIVDGANNSTLQATGEANVVGADAQLIDQVMTNMTRIYAQGGDWMPPLKKLRAGAYQIVGVTLSHVRLARFKGEQIGSQHIFTEA